MRVMEIIGQVLTELADGQLRDLLNLHVPDQTLQDYEARTYGKAAALFAGSAEIAATLCNAPAETVAALPTYGTAFGMALQIVDDVLDLESDLPQGVVTLPVLLALQEGCDRHLAGDLRRAIVGWDLPEGYSEAVTARLRQMVAVRRSVGEATRYTDRAKEGLRVLMPGVERGALEALVDSLVPPALRAG